MMSINDFFSGKNITFEPMKKRILILTVLILIFMNEHDALAQCSMCKATVESNIKSNGNFLGKGLNTGILYLMSVPYLLGAVGLGIYYHNRRKK